MAELVTAPQATRDESGWAILERITQSHAALAALWAGAGLSWLYLIRKASNGGGDIFQIWRGVRAFDTGHPMYFQHGSTMSFLYPPSASMLLAPFGVIPFPPARPIYSAIQAVAICVAVVLALRLAGRLRQWTIPVAILAASLALPVRNSMWVGNLDGVILALELLMLVAAARYRWGWAAVAFGISLALKPVLLPLVLVFVLARQWKMLAAAIAIPAVASAVALALSRDGADFVTRVIPFLWTGQSSNLQVVNVSLAGAAQDLHVPAVITVVMRVVTVGAMAGLLAVAWRRAGPRTDPGIRLAEAASIVMLGVLLAFSYAWAHYILFLLPLFALYGSDRSIVRGWIAAVAFYMLLVPDDAIWSHISIALTQLRLTFGMLLLAAALALALMSEIRQRRDNAASGAPGAVLAR